MASGEWGVANGNDSEDHSPLAIRYAPFASVLPTRHRRHIHPLRRAQSPLVLVAAAAAALAGLGETEAHLLEAVGGGGARHRHHVGLEARIRLQEIVDQLAHPHRRALVDDAGVAG